MAKLRDGLEAELPENLLTRSVSEGEFLNGNSLKNHFHDRYLREIRPRLRFGLVTSLRSAPRYRDRAQERVDSSFFADLASALVEFGARWNRRRQVRGSRWSRNLPF